MRRCARFFMGNSLSPEDLLIPFPVIAFVLPHTPNLSGARRKSISICSYPNQRIVSAFASTMALSEADCSKYLTMRCGSLAL